MIETSNPAIFPLPKDNPFPTILYEDVVQAIQLTYGTEDTLDVFANIVQRVRAIQAQRPPQLQQEDYNRPSDWYKSELIYMFYAERFGVQPNGQPNTFKDLIPMLDYLQDLGVTTLYILPFLESPMIDAGFDVSDYRKVREDLGGNAEFEQFMAAAKQRGFKIKADLILNHVSDQHAWFQAALAGDEEKLHYFVVQESRPRFSVHKTIRKGKVAVYTELGGQKSRRRIIFPDIATSHFRRVPINGREYYFYHTFYPHQLDLNWRNPKVLYEAIELLGFWANKGIDIFRLDAIPFFIKSPGTDGENRPETHAVVKILSACLQVMSPATIIQAEACQWPRDIRPYYGEERQYTEAIANQGIKALTRTNEVQIAYHFPFMPAIWASMVTQEPSCFWRAAAATPNIPESSTWAIFLRVHDELTLEMVDPKTRKTVYDALVPHGEPFREGLGVSGRLANFLANDPHRITQIYAILLSLPGIPIIYFGDEIGENNNHQFMMQAAAEREAHSVNDNVDVKSFVDTRDLARAPIDHLRYEQATTHPETFAGVIHANLRQMIAVRKQETVLSKGKLQKIVASERHIFSYLREWDKRQVLIAHNLSDAPKTVTLRLPIHLRSAALPPNELTDLRSGEKIPYERHTRSNHIRILLQPYQSVWLRLNIPALAVTLISENTIAAISSHKGEEPES